VSRRIALLTAVAAVAATAVPAAHTATHGRSFVYYAKGTRVQFISHADDRVRGSKLNPFNADIIPPPPKTGGKGAGPGDKAFFSLKLYSDAGLKRLIGTAIYSCTFNFAHQALCEADFALHNGTMLAMGPAKLVDTFGDLILPVVAGTGRYGDAHGQLTSTPSGRSNVQIIHFQLA
jgi:hypothetical protein